MGVGMGTGIGWMWLFGVLLVLGVVTLVLVATRAFTGGISGGRGAAERAPSRARAVLDERYARGELTTEEYRERLRILGEPT